MSEPVSAARVPRCPHHLELPPSLTPQGRRLLKAALCLTLVVAASAARATPLILNGSFEIAGSGGNPFAFWTTNSHPLSSGPPDFFQQQAGTVGCFNIPHAAPTAGNFAAVSQQCSPPGIAQVGASSLEQVFIVPTGVSSLLLSFDMFRDAFQGNGLNNGNLLPLAAVGKGYSRVDIMSGGFGGFLTTPAAVAMSLVAPGSDVLASNNPYVSYSFSLAVGGPGGLVAGNSYSLRFAEVHTVDRYVMGVDNVSLTANTTPEPSSLALIGLALTAAGMVTRRRNPEGQPRAGCLPRATRPCCARPCTGNGTPRRAVSAPRCKDRAACCPGCRNGCARSASGSSTAVDPDPVYRTCIFDITTSQESTMTSLQVFLSGARVVRLLLIGLAALMAGGTAGAALVVHQAVGATVSLGGTLAGSNITSTYDKSGLSSAYQSDSTPWAPYASTTTHDTLGTNEWFAAPQSILPASATVIYDLGIVTTVFGLALWNEDLGGAGRVDISFGDINLNFIGTVTFFPTNNPVGNTPYLADVIALASASNTRYVQLSLSGCPQIAAPSSFYDGCSLGEVAFAVESTVPEPGSLALVGVAGIGCIGLTALRRRDRVSQPAPVSASRSLATFRACRSPTFAATQAPAAPGPHTPRSSGPCGG